MSSLMRREQSLCQRFQTGELLSFTHRIVKGPAMAMLDVLLLLRSSTSRTILLQTNTETNKQKNVRPKEGESEDKEEKGKIVERVKMS